MRLAGLEGGFDGRLDVVGLREISAGDAHALGEIDEDNESSLADRIKADNNWTSANAVALLLFTLLYSPCFVTLAVIRQESGEWKWMFFSLFFNLGLAYAVAVAANQIMLRV